jgi:hypothetical protein
MKIYKNKEMNLLLAFVARDRLKSEQQKILRAMFSFAPCDCIDLFFP